MEVYVKLVSIDRESTDLHRVRLRDDHIEKNEDNERRGSLTCAYAHVYETIGAELDLETGTYALISHSGSKLMPWSSVAHGDVLQVCPVVLGGKGGFGSLLRAFGKQITMSTNKDACRDLTGRRIKQVSVVSLPLDL